MHHVLRASVLSALVVAATLGCEGQPPQKARQNLRSMPRPCRKPDPDQGTAEVGIVVNAPPRVDGMMSSTGNVASDSPLTLQVTASDPDHDPLASRGPAPVPASFDRADLDQVTFITGTLATGADCAFQVL